LKETVAQHEDWAIGYQDETWWSRLTHPNLHAWTIHKPLRLVEQRREKEDTEPKAFACYGIDLRWAQEEEVWLRFVEGNPKSEPTIRFLGWVVKRAWEKGIRVLVMVWDNASWHKSKMVQEWIHKHNQEVKGRGQGTRLLAFLLPVKSPWLNPIEPKWVHAKRRVVEPARKLTVAEMAERVCEVFQHPVLPWLSNPKIRIDYALSSI